MQVNFKPVILPNTVIRRRSYHNINRIDQGYPSTPPPPAHTPPHSSVNASFLSHEHPLWLHYPLSPFYPTKTTHNPHYVHKKTHNPHPQTKPYQQPTTATTFTNTDLIPNTPPSFQLNPSPPSPHSTKPLPSNGKYSTTSVINHSIVQNLCVCLCETGRKRITNHGGKCLTVYVNRKLIPNWKSLQKCCLS